MHQVALCIPFCLLIDLLNYLKSRLIFNHNVQCTNLWTSANIFNTSKKTLLTKGKLRKNQCRYQPLFPHSNMTGLKVPQLSGKINQIINLVNTKFKSIPVYLSTRKIFKHPPPKIFRLKRSQ